MTDVFSGYESGLSEVLKQLGKDHSRYSEALTLQNRLLENIARARQYGDTEICRAERAQVVSSLNQLTLETLEASFNELCHSAVVTDGMPILDQTVGDALCEVIQSENLVPIYQTSGSGQFILIGLVKR